MRLDSLFGAQSCEMSCTQVNDIIQHYTKQNSYRDIFQALLIQRQQSKQADELLQKVDFRTLTSKTEKVTEVLPQLMIKASIAQCPETAKQPYSYINLLLYRQPQYNVLNINVFALAKVVEGLVFNAFQGDSLVSLIPLFSIQGESVQQLYLGSMVLSETVIQVLQHRETRICQSFLDCMFFKLNYRLFGSNSNIQLLSTQMQCYMQLYILQIYYHLQGSDPSSVQQYVELVDEFCTGFLYECSLCVYSPLKESLLSVISDLQNIPNTQEVLRGKIPYQSVKNIESYQLVVANQLLSYRFENLEFLSPYPLQVMLNDAGLLGHTFSILSQRIEAGIRKQKVDELEEVQRRSFQKYVSNMNQDCGYHLSDADDVAIHVIVYLLRSMLFCVETMEDPWPGSVVDGLLGLLNSHVCRVETEELFYNMAGRFIVHNILHARQGMEQVVPYLTFILEHEEQFDNFGVSRLDFAQAICFLVLNAHRDRVMVDGEIQRFILHFIVWLSGRNNSAADDVIVMIRRYTGWLFRHWGQKHEPAQLDTAPQPRTDCEQSKREKLQLEELERSGSFSVSRSCLYSDDGLPDDAFVVEDTIALHNSQVNQPKTGKLLEEMVVEADELDGWFGGFI